MPLCAIHRSESLSHNTDESKLTISEIKKLKDAVTHSFGDTEWNLQPMSLTFHDVQRRFDKMDYRFDYMVREMDYRFDHIMRERDYRSDHMVREMNDRFERMAREMNDHMAREMDGVSWCYCLHTILLF